MNIENKPVEIGKGIFLKVVKPSGRIAYKPSTVLAVIEKPAAINVRYPHGEKTFKRGWFPAEQFTFTVPSPEEQKKAETKLAEKEAA